MAKAAAPTLLKKKAATAGLMMLLALLATVGSVLPRSVVVGIGTPEVATALGAQLSPQQPLSAQLEEDGRWLVASCDRYRC